MGDYKYMRVGLLQVMVGIGMAAHEIFLIALVVACAGLCLEPDTACRAEAMALRLLWRSVFLNLPVCHLAFFVWKVLVIKKVCVILQSEK